MKTNCGFCAISYALEQQKGKLVTADELYEQTLQRLGVVRQGNGDPIPRMLIFPGLNLDQAKIRVEYHELEGRGRGPADYTIWSVAQHAGLELKSGAKDLLNSLVQFGAESKPGWRLDDFVRVRMNRPELAGRATFASMKNYVETNLKGNSIVGSIHAQHFVNMAFSSAGEWKVFDAQKGLAYDGRRIRAELRSLDLFERVSTAF
ncbi:MAG: hypothetical protein P4L26_04175 [Terracidiphilus sp.]|nr:hypothetical protein [Terracidiphilus sp.]